MEHVQMPIPDRLRTREGDILLCSRNGSADLVGKNILIDSSSAGQTFGAFMTVIRSEINNHLYWFFNSSIFKSQTGLFSSTTINQLTNEILNNLIVAYPESKEEQGYISRYLQEKTTLIDVAMSKKQQLIELLQEERAAIINQAVTRGLDPNVTMKDSGSEWLPLIPKHWKLFKLKYVVGYVKGHAFKTDEFREIGIPVVKASDIKNLSIRIGKDYIDPDAAQKYQEVKLGVGDIIISTVGSTPDVKKSAVGQIAQVPLEFDGAVLNQNTVKFYSNSSLMYRDFLFFLLQTDTYRQHLDIHAHGTANQASLNIVDMLGYVTGLPPYSEQIEIVDYINNQIDILNRTGATIQQEILLLQEYRTSLINEVVTGKRCVLPAMNSLTIPDLTEELLS